MSDQLWSDERLYQEFGIPAGARLEQLRSQRDREAIEFAMRIRDEYEAERSRLYATLTEIQGLAVSIKGSQAADRIYELTYDIVQGGSEIEQ